MRTTVEITDDQRRSLIAIAARRGIRGFSPLVQEAIDLYLKEEAAPEVQSLLDMEGSLSPGEADEMERRIAEAWINWETAS